MLQGWSLDTVGITLAAASLIFSTHLTYKTSALRNKQNHKQTNNILGLYEVGEA